VASHVDLAAVAAGGDGDACARHGGGTADNAGGSIVGGCGNGKGCTVTTVSVSSRPSTSSSSGADISSFAKYFKLRSE
jgi:hypothetical protein